MNIKLAGWKVNRWVDNGVGGGYWDTEFSEEFPELLNPEDLQDTTKYADLTPLFSVPQLHAATNHEEWNTAMNTYEGEAADVLAVMDDAAHALNHTKTAPERISLLEARAAVAELIESERKGREAASREAKEIDEVIKEMRDNAKATNSNIMRYFVGRLKDARTRGMLNHG